MGQISPPPPPHPLQHCSQHLSGQGPSLLWQVTRLRPVWRRNAWKHRVRQSLAYNPTPPHPVPISQLGRWRLRAPSHLPNAPASPPALRAALSLGISFPKLTSILRALGPPRTARASARSRETLGTENSWRQRLGGHPRTHAGLRTHSACLQGVVKVAENARLLARGVLWEAGVVHVADETLEPGHGARRGQRLVGEVACWDTGRRGLAGVLTVIPPPRPQSNNAQLFMRCWRFVLPGARSLGPLWIRRPLASPLYKGPGPWGLTFVLLQWGVGMADGHQDKEEKERP